MLIDERRTVGTIGGGHLEWHATLLAREQLRDFAAAPVRVVDLVLGPQLRQCCGGRVELWLERLTRQDLPWLAEAAHHIHARRGLTLVSEFTGGGVSHRLQRSLSSTDGLCLRRAGRCATLSESVGSHRPCVWIFGAGHVGQALVRLLAELATFEITWIDARAQLLPAELPAGVTTHAGSQPAQLSTAAAPGTRFIVMTHDHELDYQVCRSILCRADPGWLGLIGSASKAARFRSRLLRDGLDHGKLAALNCPIGVSGIASKAPAAIAIAIAAQLLQLQAQCSAATPPTAAARDDAAPDDGCSGTCSGCETQRRAR